MQSKDCLYHGKVLSLDKRVAVFVGRIKRHNFPAKFIWRSFLQILYMLLWCWGLPSSIAVIFLWLSSLSIWMLHCHNHKSSSYMFWTVRICLFDLIWLEWFVVLFQISETQTHMRSLLNAVWWSWAILCVFTGCLVIMYNNS